MGIIKCEKVFAGIFFSSLLKIKIKVFSHQAYSEVYKKTFNFDRKQTRKIKNHSKIFFARMIPILITYIYIAIFSFTKNI